MTNISTISLPLFWANESEARRIYRQTAETGNLASTLCLANSYDPQFGHAFYTNQKISQFHLDKCTPTLPHLLDQLKELHYAGNPDATFNLAFCYLRKSRYNQGVSLLYEAVLCKHARAMYLLSICLAEGLGPSHNPRRSIHYCHQAAILDHDVATVSYAHHNFQGDQVTPPDIAAGEAYYWKAVERGCITAMLDLARYYEWGLYVTPNHVLSHHMYKKAAAAGSGEALIYLGDLAARLRDFTAAFDYYFQASSANSHTATALRRLSGCYRDGSGTDKNFAKAVSTLVHAVIETIDEDPSTIAGSIDEDLAITIRMNPTSASLVMIPYLIEGNARLTSLLTEYGGDIGQGVCDSVEKLHLLYKAHIDISKVTLESFHSSDEQVEGVVAVVLLELKTDLFHELMDYIV